MFAFPIRALRHGRILTAPIVVAVVALAVAAAGCGNDDDDNTADDDDETIEEVSWTQTGVGATITQEDGSVLTVSAVENSVDGDGAVVGEVTLEGNGGTTAAKRYTAQGVFVGEEEFTLGEPDADGMVPFDGTGECVEGGTGAHENEECTYTFSGTLDPDTNVVTFEVTGTSQRR